ncbi:MAG: hypothetical protein GYA55_10315 [SAR324 cluster bacterium]|uniref:HD/PDEase domain-containing protein n=1 Tax=SAR324 cluster bacterium TaxID=2024889 RepID=A0A7X9FSQ1_9DELT|nr:hypothetical protein [SAR324 cluster bacterium]
MAGSLASVASEPLRQTTDLELFNESFSRRPAVLQGRKIFELPEPAPQKKWWDGPGIYISFDELSSISNSFFALGKSMPVFIDFCLGVSSRKLPLKILNKVVELNLLSSKNDARVSPRVQAIALAIDGGMSGKLGLRKASPVEYVLDFLNGNRFIREQCSEQEAKSRSGSEVSLDSFRVQRTLDELKEVFLDELYLNIPQRDHQSIVKRALETTLQWHAHAKPRHNGESSATHPIYCALSLLRLGVTDPGVISVSLLHDILEDTKYCFPESEKERELPLASANEIRRWGFNKLFSDFGRGLDNVSCIALAYSVVKLSKNALDRNVSEEIPGYEPYMRELCLLPESLTVQKLLDELNYMGARELEISPSPEDLEDITAKVIQFVMLSKVADRRDNLRSIERYCPEKIERKLFETTEYLLPSFRKPLPIANGELETWHSLERARIWLEEIATSEVQELSELVGKRRSEPLAIQVDLQKLQLRSRYPIGFSRRRMSWFVSWLVHSTQNQSNLRGPHRVV